MNNHLPFINRETSWLDFNERVLNEAQDPENPVLEKLKFLSIVTGNLEEFFMIRVAVLKRQDEPSLEDLEPSNKALPEITKRVQAMLSRQYEIYKNIVLPELNQAGIQIKTSENELEEIKELLYPVFERDILPLITPLSVGPTHPFPTLVTGRLYIAVGLSSLPENNFLEKSSLSFIEVPTAVFGRFYRLGDEDTFIPAEILLKLFVSKIFPGYQVNSAHAVRVTRDSDFDLQEDGASDLLKEIETTIKRLHQRSVVKLEHEKGIPEWLLNVLADKNGLLPGDIYPIEDILNLKDLMQLYDKIQRNDLKLRLEPSVYPEIFRDKNPFDVISDDDVLLFHPYHSYDPVVELVNFAANDPGVLAIKQTLYRTSSNSTIIRALVRAAENGKYVTVIDELKARFDEKRNIEWAKRLEDAGAHVTYGVANLKTHAKSLLIVRKEAGGIKRYVHLATGNYNETTARLYTDFSLFTCDDRTGEDVSALFNLLTGFSQAETWHRITVAPMNLRAKFVSLIRRETENAKKGMTAKIKAKLNSLSDPDMIRSLYEASNAGVKIDLIVRGICSLVPGVGGFSENITVRSIIGQYLEHSRVFYFYNAGDEEFYLSSADWMLRNLDRRIEILFPVRSEKAKIMIKHILKLQFEDVVNTWELKSDSNYRLVTFGKKVENHNSFNAIYRYIKKNEEDSEKQKPFKIMPVKSAD